MPLDPKQIVSDAERAGIIARNEAAEKRLTESVLDAAAHFILNRYKTPEEAGIARLPSSTPKRNRPKTDPSRRKWITKGEAKAKGYAL